MQYIVSTKISNDNIESESIKSIPILNQKPKDVKELYERLIPALNTKVTELKRNDMDYIKKEDIWNYLKAKKWVSANNLLLHEMVDDILNLDNYEIDEYVKSEIRKKVIKPNLEDMKRDDLNEKEDK